jgi:23S rRNA (adenine2503-C2)-methyltransferase
MHVKLVRSFDEMTNISKDLRERLASEYEFTSLRVERAQESALDGTIKFLFELADKNYVESVFMRYKHGNSVCISSQVGCRMGCRFCASTIDGCERDLLPSEMLDQIYAISRYTGERISNVVVMGMGEPLDNYDNLVRSLRILLDPRAFDYSRRKITLSSVGHVPGLKALARENLGINLAISLHAASDELRSQIMPANRIWGLDELFDTLKSFPLDQRQRITFEYIIIKGLNHSPHDANLLVKRLHGIPSKVNLIGFNAFAGCKFKSPSEAEMLEFQEWLLSKGLSTTIRLSRGDDELAACGQLGHRGDIDANH